MQPSLERRGHNWQVAEDARLRHLDVGTGQGLLAALLLDAFPAPITLRLDGSEPMRATAAERIAAYGDRVRLVLGDQT